MMPPAPSASPPAPSGRDGHLDTLRGIACILLVAYHVIGNDSEHGMRIVEVNGWRTFTELFIHLRMPLFSFLSGYVFSMSVADLPALRFAFVKKLRRLGIPLVVVSTLFFICFGVVNHELAWPTWRLYLLPYEHYWYLQSTLIIMTLLLLVGYAAGEKRRIAATMLFPIACVTFVAAWQFVPDWFGITTAFYLLPFFLAGQLLRAWRVDPEPARRKRLLAGLGLLLAVLYAADFGRLQGWNGWNFDRQSALGLLFGLANCVFLFLWRFRVGLLQSIGRYSYTIYLFHVFFTAGVTKTLYALHPTATYASVFIVSLPAGLIGPAILHSIAVRYRWPALLLLGIDKRPKPRPLAEPLATPAALP